MRLWHSLRSEANSRQQLEIFIAAVKFMEANWPQKKEFLVHSERLVYSSIDETFIWILAALFMASISGQLEF